ncbi:MAG: hypothetical protein R3E89_12850 [Thiolinea sp.]
MRNWTRALDWLETIPAGDAGRAWGQRYHRGFDAVLVFLEASRGAEEQRKLREARERGGEGTAAAGEDAACGGRAGWRGLWRCWRWYFGVAWMAW